VAPTVIPKVSILKINVRVWLNILHEEEDNHNATDDGAEDRYSSELQKAHFTGEFVIVAKFGGHALRLGLQM